MLCRAACSELSCPSRQLWLITTSIVLGTAGKIRSASAPNTTTTFLENEQFSTAISSAVFLPKRANAFGKGSACELPAARIIGMICSRLRILRLRQNKRTERRRLVGERCVSLSAARWDAPACADRLKRAPQLRDKLFSWLG